MSHFETKCAKFDSYRPFVSLFVRLFVCLSVCLFVRLYVRLSICVLDGG